VHDRFWAGVLIGLFVLSVAIGFSEPSSARAALAPAPNFGAAEDPACKPVFDAMDKLLDVPTHEFMTKSAGKNVEGKATTSELISVNGMRYVMVGGKWHKSPQTTAQLREQELENRKNAKFVSCKKLGGETVQGEGATVYTISSENEDIRSYGKLWISSSRGLPLKEELAVDTDDPNSEHVNVRFEYSNVRPPQL
jgi:hypothetical protein